MTIDFAHLQVTYSLHSIPIKHIFRGKRDLKLTFKIKSNISKPNIFVEY